MKILVHTSILFAVFCFATASRRLTVADKWEMLQGRWEVLSYSEQGIQVNKKQPALRQAVQVWQHISRTRAMNFYGFDPENDEKRPRKFDRWFERDSTTEVARVAEAIATPYFAVFFADSTLSCYNKDTLTNTVFFPETFHARFSPVTNSIDINFPGVNITRWQAQIVRLEENRLTLFLPEEAEIVELRKTVFSLP